MYNKKILSVLIFCGLSLSANASDNLSFLNNLIGNLVNQSLTSGFCIDENALVNYSLDDVLNQLVELVRRVRQEEEPQTMFELPTTDNLDLLMGINTALETTTNRTNVQQEIISTVQESRSFSLLIEKLQEFLMIDQPGTTSSIDVFCQTHYSNDAIRPELPELTDFYKQLEYSSVSEKIAFILLQETN